MVKNKHTRKYVTVSLSRDYIHDLDFFLKNSSYAKIYTSKADFIHKAINQVLEQYEFREVNNEVKELKDWYYKNTVKLQKRGINSWEDLFDRAITYSERIHV